MNRRNRILELLNEYVEETGKTTFTTDEILSYIQSHSGRSVMYFKNRTKREMASLLRAHIKKRKKQRKKTVFSL